MRHGFQRFRHQLFGRPTLSGESRGILPLIAAALAAGAGRAIVGGVMANQTKQRNKGYISAQFRAQSERMNVHHGDIRQSTNEDLNRRGLVGSNADVAPSHEAIMGYTPEQDRENMRRMRKGGQTLLGPSVLQAASGAPSTLGGNVQKQLGHEFGLDRKELSDARDRALNENKADYLNAIVGAIGSGAQTATSVYGMGKDIGAMQSTGSSTIGSAMMGIDDPGAAWGGINPVDPLGGANSAWNPSRAVVGVGQPNFSFRV